MRVAGVDVSSYAVDVVWVDLDDTRPPDWGRYELAGADAFDRARTIRDAMPPRTGAHWEETLAIGIEVAHGPSSGAVNRCIGAVMACLPTSVLVKPFTATEWKRGVGLPGNASKGHVRAHARGELVLGHGTVVAERKTPLGIEIREYTYPPWIEEWPQDALDAYCIAVATRLLIQQPDRKEAA